MGTMKSLSVPPEATPAGEAETTTGWLSKLDPRRHLAAAIGWSMLVVLVLASLVAGNLTALEVERAARASTERQMTQFAHHLDHGLWIHLRNRMSVIQVTAAQIAASGDKEAGPLRHHLKAVRAQFPEFTWLGVIDTRGRVVAAADRDLEGESVAALPWFASALNAPYLGGLRRAVLLEKHVPPAPDGQPLHVIDVAAPIRLDNGAVVGVVVGYLASAWLERLKGELLGALGTSRELELILADGQGLVMVGPADWLGRTLQAGDDLSEGGRYIVGRSTPNQGERGFGWRVAVRQSAEPAMVLGHELRRTIYATVWLAGVLAALAALTATHWLTRRLAALADDAAAVRRGQRDAIAVPAGHDEVSRIGAALSALVEHLQREKAALARLNADLDARVAERTARLERLADESRHAAVTRERLRMARDLHDTLAHSLMALLTQLRLVRKLGERMPPEELRAELARAEEVAASGLSDARAVITQMRHGTVRENGLAAGLRDLLTRMSERCGVAADLADERAETLYRIVEEALRNVERHAAARSVVVEIDDAPAATSERQAEAVPYAILTIRDDGIGFDTSAARPGHYGMLGMREQADLVGAEFTVYSAAGRGTTLHLRFAI